MSSPDIALQNLLKFVKNNLGLASLFKTLFRTTLEYLQFLVNDRTKAIKLHSTIKAIVNSPIPNLVPPHKIQCASLEQFHELYCQLADAIESDNTNSQWGNIYPPTYNSEYLKRKHTYASHMNTAWQQAQHTITVNDIQHCWSLD